MAALPDTTLTSIISADATINPLCHFQVLNEDDDVFITGVLREALGLGSPRFLNPRYTFDISSVEKWLRGSSGLPLPWIFAGGITDVQLMSQLWTKTLQIHEDTNF